MIDETYKATCLMLHHFMFFQLFNKFIIHLYNEISMASLVKYQIIVCMKLSPLTRKRETPSYYTFQSHDMYAGHCNILVWLIINFTNFLIIRTKTAALAGFGIISRFTLSIFCWANKILKCAQNLASQYKFLTHSFIYQQHKQQAAHPPQLQWF